MQIPVDIDAHKTDAIFSFLFFAAQRKETKERAPATAFFLKIHFAR